MKYRQIDIKALEAFIESSGLSYKTGSKSWKFNCPLCDKKQKLFISKVTGQFICFYCVEGKGFKGRPEYALHELTGQSISKIRQELYDENFTEEYNSKFLVADFLEDQEDILQPVEVFDIKEFYWPYHCYDIEDKNSELGIKYLESRGVSLDIAKLHGVKYSTVERSVAFPVTIDNVLVGLQYRTIDPLVVTLEDGSKRERIKSKSSINLPRDRSIMFENRLKDICVLTEGPFDALKAYLVGGNIATMGKVVTKHQANRIIMSGIKKLYLAKDPDASMEIHETARMFDMPMFYVEIPSPYKDLGEMDFEFAKDTIFSSKPYNSNKIYLYLK